MNGQFKIESGIPVAASHHVGNKKPESPFTKALRKLRVGQSFAVRRPANKVATHAYMWRLYHGKKTWKFVVRPEGAGCRIWRVK